MVLSWQIVRFQLKETFAIAYGNYTHREALILTLEKHGTKGYGECTAIDYYNISLSDFDHILLKVKSKIETRTLLYRELDCVFLFFLIVSQFFLSQKKIFFFFFSVIRKIQKLTHACI